MDFTIKIDDKPQLLGITAAREDYNASIPAQVQNGTDNKGKPIMVANPALLATDGDYFQARALGMFVSWAKQHGTDVVEIDAKITDLQAKRADIVAKGADVAEPVKMEKA